MSRDLTSWEPGPVVPVPKKSRDIFGLGDVGPDFSRNPSSFLIMRELLYLGPAETFTEQAAKALNRRLGDEFRLVPKRSLEELIESVDASTVAVVPYYNLYEGLIQETLDLITEHRRAIAAAQRVAVRFAFGRWRGAPTDVVYSHPKALAQCSTFLSKNFRESRKQEVLSTSEATRIVAEQRAGAAIARRQALEKAELEIIADDIGNLQYGRTNYTEFLFVVDDDSRSPFSESQSLRTMVAVIPTVDRVGLLADILGQLAFFGINLLKIHSRPGLVDPPDNTPFEHDPQMFYLEMETPQDEPAFRLCLESLNMRLARAGECSEDCVRILGKYPLFLEE